jgi:hypothetical protein
MLDLRAYDHYIHTGYIHGEHISKTNSKRLRRAQVAPNKRSAGGHDSGPKSTDGKMGSLASYVPSLRATQADPVEVLRGG